MTTRFKSGGLAGLRSRGISGSGFAPGVALDPSDESSLQPRMTMLARRSRDARYRQEGNAATRS
jgi:hypothetical protein